MTIRLFIACALCVSQWLLVACSANSTDSAPSQGDSADARLPIQTLDEKASKASATTASPARLRYRVSIPKPDTQRAQVEVYVPAGGQEQIELMMPVWTPGSYLVREYSRHMENLSASAENGAPLSITKVRKNRWRIDTAGHDQVVVRYGLYCNNLSVRGNFVTDEFAIFNGAPTFVTLADDATARVHEVKFVVPKTWARSYTGLAPHPARDAHHYVAPDYDTLVDSPVLLGNPKSYRFDVENIPHVLVNQGEDGIWRGQQSFEDVKKITQVIADFWGVMPYERYYYLNVIDDGRGGLEHKNSTLMIAGRWKSTLRKDYLSWLGLVSHEYFHTWNVKRLRPVALGPFDYETEVHTESLWIAEGLTSYYDDLLLMRAGILTQKEYLEKLSKNIERLQSTPGRLHHALGMTSYDAWTKFYRGNEDSVNSTVSYYTKGAVVGFLLDVEIRKATDGAKSLDDVMRLAYKRYAGERGFKPEEFRAVASEIAGVNLDAFFTHAVDGVGELDYAPATAYFGLRFKDPNAPKDKDDESGKDGKKKAEEAPKDPPAGWLGVRTRHKHGRLVVESVLRNSPAMNGGVSPGDEIVGIDGFRVTAKNFEERLGYYPAGSQLKLLVARRQKLKERTVILAPNRDDLWDLEVVPEPTDDQSKRLGAWLTPKK